MKNLILVRHAKSSWETPLEDIERPLLEKGINDANLVASKISNYLPSTYLVWSSVAKRAKETALIFAQNISYPPENIEFKNYLYTFDETQLEKLVKSCNNFHESIILFGHNPAISNFVNKFGNYHLPNVPTSGFVSIQFEEDQWSNIKKGRILKTIFSKDLK